VTENIWDKWARGRDIRRPEEVPTNAEMWDSCHANVLKAQRDLADAELVMKLAPIGLELQNARHKCARYHAEIAHWEGYVEHYRRATEAEDNQRRAERAKSAPVELYSPAQEMEAW
jgi:predicted Fe-S protein YdhL (DUF1289 family)